MARRARAAVTPERARLGPALIVALTLTGCIGGASKSRGDACDLNSQCDTPLVCRLGRCRVECATSRDCTQRTQCLVDELGLGACQLGDETRCALDSDCPAGLVCGQTRCLNECATDRDCLAGAACVRTDGGSDDACDGASGCVCRDRAQVACLYDGDCRSGDDPSRWLACIGGACRPECVTDRDCPSFRCLPLAPELLERLGTDGGYCGPPSECERWYVREGATGPGIGGWADASGDLPAVLAAAANRPACAEIWVAEGRYVAPAEGFVVAAGVQVHGGFAGDELVLGSRHGGATVLSGDRAGDDPASRADNAPHVVDVPALASRVLLDGLTISGGQASGAGEDGAGGGVRIGRGATEVALRAVRLVDNEASGGGGLSALAGASVLVVESEIADNRAPLAGGGGADHVGSTVRYEDTVFRGNSGQGAGGLNAIAGARVELLRCELVDNTAEGLGGAMRVGATSEAAEVTLVSSSLRANRAATGGAIHAANAATVLRLRNVIAWGNEASADGGALSLVEGARALVAASTLARNRAAGLGGAIHVVAPAVLEMTNSIAWASTAATADPTRAQVEGDLSGVSYCALEGHASGDGNVAAGALFADLDGGADADLAPAVGSTAIGAGDPARLPLDELDADADLDVVEPLPTDRLGAPRLRSGALDLGAVQRDE